MIRIFHKSATRDIIIIFVLTMSVCLLMEMAIYSERVEIFLLEFNMDVDFKTECRATAECGDFTYRFDPTESRGCKLIKGDYSRLFGLTELRGSRRVCQMMKMPKKEGWKFVNEWDEKHGFRRF